jgi:hypothetical protein
MSTTYAFIKDINPTKLQKEIKASAIGSKFLGISTVGNKATFHFNAELITNEYSTLTDILDDHSTTDASAHVSGKILKAREFGTNLIVEFGTRNILAGLTTEQISSMMALLNPVISALVTGSLNVAVAEIDKVTPDAILTAELIAEYRAKIVAFLATL